ncbi:MAG TPA: glycosyltransferase family 4 protein [Gemmatimonadales bacterium]
MNQRPGVLIVDQGASFGGSALVASVIVNRMPPDRYRVFLAAAVEAEVLRVTEVAQSRVVHLAKPYDYVGQARTRERLAVLPGSVRRLGGWADTGLRLLRNAGYTRRLMTLIREEGIALLHLNNGFENLEAHLAAGLTATPALVHAHGPCGNSYVTRRLARRAPACIAISKPVVESFRSVEASPGRIALLSNPLTVEPGNLSAAERSRSRARYGIPPDLVLVGIVGRIVAWKGQLEFLRAAALALRQVPGSGAVIIGDVTDANDAYGRLLRDEVRQLGLQDRVWFTGFIQDPDEAYGLLDVLVHSSIEPEPFGLVLTEAMAYGIPVVAAGSGGPLEIVTDGVDGFLRDPRDVAAVGVLLAQLLRDPGRRARVGSAGRATVLRRFDPDQYVRRIAEVYDAVLERNAGVLSTSGVDGGPFGERPPQ